MAAVTVVLSWHVGEQEVAVSAWFIELEEGLGCPYRAPAAAHYVRYEPGDFSAVARRHPDDSGGALVTSVEHYRAQG